MSQASCAISPSCRRARPRGPNIGFIMAWVLIAPTGEAQGQRLPTAKKREAMAIPNKPVGESLATIDQVMAYLLIAT